MSTTGNTTEELFHVAQQYLVGGVGYRFLRACFERGVYFHNYGRLALGHYGFSAAHTPADVDETLNGVESALKAMRA